ncbi:MAG: putative streptomycin biosynthesis operon possible regulatory protein [Methanothrix harundinacea]|nr:MAG: putative streptomycin biosynthesis operon possible regulatory protein [Methanothrix harundinacea]
MAELALSLITLDADLQPRVMMDQATIDEYADEMKSGETFPPITVFDDGDKKWLADGWHRYLAAQKTGLEEINVDLRVGSRRDALLFSISANARHGLRRTRDDKRRSIMALLSDPEWSELSDRELAKLAGVTHPTIAKYRHEFGSGKFTRLNCTSPLSAKVWEFFDGEGLPLFENFYSQGEYITKELIVVANELEKVVDHMKECGITDLWGDTWPFYNKGLLGVTKADALGIYYMIKLEPHPQPCNFWMELFELHEPFDDDDGEEELLESSAGTGTAYKKSLTFDRVGFHLEMIRDEHPSGVHLSDFTEWYIHDSEPSYIPPFLDEYPEIFDEWQRGFQISLEEQLLQRPEKERYPTDAGLRRSKG